MYSNSRMKQRVLLVGGDAVDLLHRISTINLKTLNLGESVPGLILSPQGKIACFFKVLKKTPHELEIEFEDRFLELLDQFTFGERYEIRPLPSPNEDFSQESNRIQNLIPKLGNEFKNDETTNPLEVNLRSAIHDQKGCYPGQEVIEKVISLGSPARKLALVQGSHTSSLPAAIIDPQTNAEVGTLTSFHEGFGLAILRRTHVKEGLQFKTPSGSLTLLKVSP